MKPNFVLTETSPPGLYRVTFGGRVLEVVTDDGPGASVQWIDDLTDPTVNPERVYRVRFTIGEPGSVVDGLESPEQSTGIVTSIELIRNDWSENLKSLHSGTAPGTFRVDVESGEALEFCVDTRAASVRWVTFNRSRRPRQHGLDLRELNPLRHFDIRLGKNAVVAFSTVGLSLTTSRVVAIRRVDPQRWSGYPMAAGEAAVAIRRAIAAADYEAADRLLTEAVSSILSMPADESFSGDVLAEPETTGNERYDTLLATGFAYALTERGSTPLEWMTRPPALREEWLWDGDVEASVEFRSFIRSQTPRAFLTKNILLRDRDLRAW